MKQVGEICFAHLLEEDEEGRLEGFYDPNEPLRETPRPAFEERQQQTTVFDENNRYEPATGKPDEFWFGEAEEVLSWPGIEKRADPNSNALRLVAVELLR
ncbi:MAG: hypothetical protein KUG74_01890 [Rhodobacteraceae bacterium]|nr:hypothetical protein [Paracoccaceae bacterium]